MKNTKFIIIPIIALLVCIVPVYFITKSGINTMNRHLLPGTDKTVSRNNIEYEKIGFLWQKGNPAVSFSGLLIKRSENSNDTLFYAEHVVISTGLKHKSKHDTGTKIIILSPQIHIYPDQISETGTEDIPDLSTSGKINSMPSLFIANLSIYRHTEEETQTISGIHLKTETGHSPQTNIHIQAKHNSTGSRVYHAGTHFSYNQGHYSFDSSYIKLNDVKLMNLNLQIQSHLRSDNDVEWKAWLDSTRLEQLSADSLQFNGYLAYRSSGKSSAKGFYEKTGARLHTGIETEYGKADNLTINYSRHKDFRYGDSIADGHFSLNFNSGDSYAQIQSDYSKNGNKQSFSLTHLADIATADINLFKKPVFQGYIKAGYTYHGSNKSVNRTKGFSKADISWPEKYGYSQVTHNADHRGSKWNVKKGDNLTVAVQMNQLFDYLFFNKTLELNTTIQQQALNIPAGKSRQTDMPDLGKADKKRDFLKNINLSVTWIADSIYAGNKLLSANNTAILQTHNKRLSFTSNHDISGNINGPLSTNFHGNKETGYAGKLSSTGLTIKDKSDLPLISRNLKLPPAEGNIKPFKLPVTYAGGKLHIETTNIRTDDFILHVSGNGTINKQNFILGLTAPPEQFKGPAAMVLKNKSDTSASKTLNTVLLHINRQDGKFHIKTKVP